MKKIKKKKSKGKNFIARMDPALFEIVDQALALLEQGKVRRAEKILSDLLEKHPENHMVHYGMGIVWGLKGRHDEAIACFDRSIKIFPYFVEAWFNKGSSHQLKLQVGEMFRSFEKVVELGDPSEAYVQRAKQINSELQEQIRKQHGLSVNEYLKGMNRFNDAFAAMERREWEEALEGFQSVLRIDSNHTQSYGNAGICLAQMGRMDEAMAAFDKALELDPEYEPARRNRAVFSAVKQVAKTELPIQTVEYYKEALDKKKPLKERILGLFKREI
jgi:tetratricopeptide (TPR) repeat protein